MTFTTSEPYLFTSEDREREASREASEALLIALKREHPQIVRHLQAAAKPSATETPT